MGKRGSVAVRAKRTSGKCVSVSADCLKPSPGMTKRGRTVWAQMMVAFPVGFFTEADRVLLEQFCEAAGLHRAATAALVKEGWRYKDAKGVWRKNAVPLDIQRDSKQSCAMLATKLRITKQAMVSPKVAGRAALDAAEHTAVAGSEFGDLLFGGDGVRQ